MGEIGARFAGGSPKHPNRIGMQRECDLQKKPKGSPYKSQAPWSRGIPKTGSLAFP